MQIRILGNLILASTLIASAQATAVFSLGRAFAVDNLLVARQTTSCDPVAVCAVFSNAVTGCTTTGCICTVANANSLQSCVTCSVNTAPTTAVIADAVQLVNTFKGACTGFNLPNIQVPNPSPPKPSPTPVVTPTPSPTPVVAPTPSPTPVVVTPIPSTTPGVVTTPPPITTTPVVPSPSTTLVIQTTVKNPGASLTDNNGPMTTIGPGDLQTTTPAASGSSTVSKSSGTMTAPQGLSRIVAGTLFMLFCMLLV